MFDEFRIAACIYTITVGTRSIGADLANQHYWPLSHATIMTAFDRMSRNNEEYITIKPGTDQGAESAASMYARLVSEPSCKLFTKGGQQ